MGGRAVGVRWPRADGPPAPPPREPDRTGRLVSMWTRVDGLRVHARVSAEPLPPDAPTIVLVHGVAVSNRYLLPAARHLAPRARVYVPDLPGYGKSDKPPLHTLTVPHLADWLVAWMDAIGLKRAHMLGNSFGCQILADLAVRHPERIDRLVLQGPTMDPHARTAARQVGRWLATSVFERKSEGLVLLRDLIDIGLRRLVGMVEIGLNDPIEEKLPNVCLPTLVVRGSHDLIVPEIWAEEATALLPDGRLVVVDGAAHTINYSQPAWLRDVIWPFLTEGASTEDADGPSLTSDGHGTPHAPAPTERDDSTWRTTMTERPDPSNADGSEPNEIDRSASAPTGSEPGGGAGTENIERNAGVASGQPTSTERAVREMAEAVDGADQGSGPPR